MKKRRKRSGSKRPVITRGMSAVLVGFKGPAVSINRPSVYQVTHTLPLPLPPTLVGALGKGLGLLGECEPEDAGCFRKAWSLLAATSPIVPVSGGESPLNQPIAGEWPVVLIRSRILEMRNDAKNKKNKKEEKEGEEERKDAMIRTYLTPHTDLGLLAVYVLNDSQVTDLVIKSLRLVDRLGDSESLVTVHFIEECVLEDSQSNGVNSLVRLEDVKSGSFVAVNVEYKGLNWKSRIALPITLSSTDNMNSAYYPSIIEVKDEVNVLKCNGGSLEAYVPSTLSYLLDWKIEGDSRG